MSEASKPTADDHGADDDAVKDAFRAALERKKSTGGSGKGVGAGGGGSKSGGSTKAAGGRRTFQRKSGSS